MLLRHPSKNPKVKRADRLRPGDRVRTSCGIYSTGETILTVTGKGYDSRHSYVAWRVFEWGSWCLRYRASSYVEVL